MNSFLFESAGGEDVLDALSDFANKVKLCETLEDLLAEIFAFLVKLYKFLLTCREYCVF